jgi:diguanylate cyclase (GGDEF)-like protein
MTKLYNRRYFTKISEHILDLSKREKQDLSIIMLDIDKFKNINDTLGHKVGDDVIIILANKLIEYQRKSDIICRYGGEEFVVLLPNTSIDSAKLIAQRIRKDVESLTISIVPNKDLKFTISLGVSSVDVNNEQTIELALKRADDTLYEAKNSGRNRVCIYKNKI